MMFFFDVLFMITLIVTGWLCSLLLAGGIYRMMQALHTYFQWKDRRCLNKPGETHENSF